MERRTFTREFKLEAVKLTFPRLLHHSGGS